MPDNKQEASEVDPNLSSIIEGMEGASDPISPMDVRPGSYDYVEEALDAYRDDKLMSAGMGNSRSYRATASFGIAGVLSLALGGILLAKGRTALGSASVGVGAGCGVGSYVTYPETVPLVGYHLRVSDTRYVTIRVPLGLTDDEFICMSNEQKETKTALERFVLPSVYVLEELQARRDHRDELASGLDPDSHLSDEDEDEDENEDAKDPPSPPVSTPAPSAPSSSSSKAPASVSMSSSSADDALKKPEKPKKLQTPAITDLSSAEQKAASKVGVTLNA